MYVDWCIKTSFGKCSICRPRQNFVFPRSFISNFFFQVICYSKLSNFFQIFHPTRFKLSTYTAIIANSISNFLMKMHGYIGLFIYPSFSKYSLKRLYHMHPKWFNPYKNRCNLIEYMLRGFVQFVLGNLNHSGIFMYISLSMDPYKYTVITFMRRMRLPN